MIPRAHSNAPESGPSSLLPAIGHELRNPLSSILAQAETLQDGLHGPVTPAQSAALQAIQTDVHRTLALITDLVDLGRIEASGLDLQPAACQLQTIQQQAIETAWPTALARSIQLAAEPAPDIQLHADAARLRQIISELLAAVLLSAPVGGRAWLMLSQIGGRLQIQAGNGLSWADFALLPLPVASDPASDVLGRHLLALKPLGMSLLGKLIQLWGGTFVTQATAGGAVRLTVQLPLSPDVSAAAATLSTPAATMPAPTTATLGRAPVILLADDQPTLVSVTTHYLENLGFEVHNARDGQEAILQTQKLRPDLILMDVRMPLLEGPQAIQTIRGSNDPYMRSVPIISLSGQPGTADRDRCLNAGATAHLSKPFGVKELDAAIRQFIAPPAPPA